MTNTNTVSNSSRLRRHALLVLIVGFAVVFFSSSIKNTFQVYFVQMADSFGQSRGEFAVAAAVFMLMFGIASPIVGFLADRIGPKKTILLGLVSSGVAFIGCALFESFFLFIIFYGIIAAFGLTAMSYVPLGVMVDQAFSEKRKGLAYATLTNGVAIGFMLLSPVWVFSQEYVQWRSVYLALGLLFMIPMLIAVYRLLPDSPANGDQTPRETTASSQPLRERLSLVFSSRTFFALMFGFFGCGVTMAFIDVHMVAHLQDLHLSPAQISVALVLLGATELVGAFLAGWLCDRVPKAYVIAGFYLIRALSLVVILFMPNATGAFLFVCLFGISYLATVVGTSLYTLGLFGQGNKGFAFGFIWLAHQIGAFLSTQLGANTFDRHGSYDWAIIGTAAFALLSFALSVLLLSPNPTPVEHRVKPQLSET